MRKLVGVPVVVATGSAHRGAHETAASAGAELVVVKPVDYDELQRTFAELFARLT